MNISLHVIGHPLASRLGWVLLHSLWQGALVGAAFGLLRLALRRRSANARYVAGCVALAVPLAASLLTLILGSTPSAGARDSQSAMTHHPSAASNHESSSDAYLEGGTYRLVQSAAELLGRLAPSLAMVWLLGVAIF